MRNISNSDQQVQQRAKATLHHLYGAKIPRWELGDRVRLNELGQARSPKMRGKVGWVVKLPKSITGAIKIAFDGNKVPSSIHHSYLELEVD